MRTVLPWERKPFRICTGCAASKECRFIPSAINEEIEGITGSVYIVLRRSILFSVGRGKYCDSSRVPLAYKKKSLLHILYPVSKPSYHSQRWRKQHQTSFLKWLHEMGS